MAVAAFIVSLLLVVDDPSVIAEEPLRVLSEVVLGPARGRPLALHLDTALPVDLQREVEYLKAVRGIPHITFSFGHTHDWQVAVGGVLPDSSHTLHILLWFKPRPELLHTLCRQWQPRSLLLLTLGPFADTAVLLEEALSGVDRLALIGHLSDESDALGVYTALPFSGGGVRFLGPWRSEAFTGWEELFPDRFPSFDGYTFHLATDFRDPLHMYSTAAEPEVGRGVSVRILDAMAPKLNYSYTLTPLSPDLKWGIIENGSWVGLLGMIARKEKNFTVNSFYITEERIISFDPSESVGESQSSVFLPSPQPLPEWLSLVRPFSSAAWIFLLLAVVLAIVFMMTMEREAARRIKTSPRGGEPCTWQVLPRAAVAQSMPAVPEALWQRVFLAMWLLSCLVITAAYTCDLVRIFTRITYPSRLQKLWDLADSHYRVAVVSNGAFIEKEVRNSPKPLYERLRQRLDEFDEITDAVAALQRGGHAYLTSELTTRLTLTKTLKDDEWYVMDERIFSGPTFWLFPKNAPWKAKFDSILRKLKYFGLIDHWLEMEFAAWVNENVDRIKLLDSRVRGNSPTLPLSLQHLQGVFYIVGLSWLAGGALLLLELLWAYTHQH